MKIGIIGTGNMGRAVGVRLGKLGHEVFFGARSREKAEEAVGLSGGSAASGSVDQAAEFGEVIFWTLRETDPAKVVKDAWVLSGKTVVDLNNRDFANEVHTGAWFQKSIGETLQESLPGSKIVKAFNTLAMEAFDTDPDELRAVGAQTFLAGGDSAAKETVAHLANDLGLEAIDLGGGPVAMRAAEALGDAVRLLMIDDKRGGRAHFKLITLPEPNLGEIGRRQKSDYA